MQHFTTVTDFTPDQLQQVLYLSSELQQNSQKYQHSLVTKNILFCFEKPSLRTLIGTESALNQLGANVIHTTPEAFLGGKMAHAGDICPDDREALTDTVKNVGQFCNAIFVRVFAHNTIERLAKLSEIPVVNALCDQHHPMQALADMLTLQQTFGSKQKLQVVFVGDGNNVAYSLGQILLMLGHTFVWAGPQSYSFEPHEQETLQQLEKQYGGTIRLLHDAAGAVKAADAVCTDTWVSMGEDSGCDQKSAVFGPFQVNKQLMMKAPEHAIFLHCLPAHRDKEVTNEVMDGPQSLVYQQAKNRMITSKGLFNYLLKSSNI